MVWDQVFGSRGGRTPPELSPAPWPATPEGTAEGLCPSVASMSWRWRVRGTEQGLGFGWRLALSCRPRRGTGARSRLYLGERSLPRSCSRHRGSGPGEGSCREGTFCSVSGV